VLDLATLEKTEFSPLFRILHHALQDRESMRLLTATATDAAMATIFELLFWPIASWVHLFGLVVIAGAVALGMFLNDGTVLDSKTTGFAAVCIVTPFVLFGALMRALLTNVRVRRVISQRIKTRELTNEILEKLLGGNDADKEIVGALLAADAPTHDLKGEEHVE
jgi:hypothetical protein